VVERDLKMVIGEKNPGVGEYEVKKYKTITEKEFQGGAPNNFAFFSKNYQQTRSPDIIE
jgi:hypothetical protein